ncbi:hypothetical protein ACI2JB_01140 [Pantoea agglomerans]|uniref:hypothetical protein n=1 Tax=Enterobacter agglomerans TaxID=549 RepID=UPI00385017FB
MKITEAEMRGLITGKAMPADINFGESLSAYLVRKFAELNEKIIFKQNLTEQVVALQAQRDALAAENAILKNGIGFFSYGTDSGFEEHDSAEKAIAAADSDIDYYRGDACDGWSEETDQTVWGVILQRATMIDERPRTEEDSYLGSHIASICDYALLPNIATPATDAYLNSVRAEGIHFAANRILAAWKSCLIKATPAEAADVSGAVLSALEFLPKANPEEFKRDYADQVRADIAELFRAGKDGE